VCQRYYYYLVTCNIAANAVAAAAAATTTTTTTATTRPIVADTADRMNYFGSLGDLARLEGERDVLL